MGPSVEGLVGLAGMLMLVQPETVIRWHREGFRLYWRWRSRALRSGRPKAAPEIRVPTATIRVLFVFLILSNARRRVVHSNVTGAPSAAWTGQQVVEAFPWDTASRYLLRDRDGVYGIEFARRVDGMGVKQVPISARSPWQNPYIGRLIGSIRRECLDHVIILSERQLRRVLRSHLDHYHGSSTHLGLKKDCPDRRPIELPDQGPISEEPMIGGLHHRYYRQAA